MLFGPSDIAVVTGASGGIGAAIARELAMEGAPVVVHYANNGDAAASVVAEIRAKGGKAVRYRADVRDEQQVVGMFRVVRKRLGPVRLLVNNAGVTADGFAALLSSAQWTDVIDTNLTGAFFCTREAMKPMIYAKRGSVVNVSSVSGIAGTPGQTNYSASKAGLIGLTRSLSREVAQFGIRVNAVAPGLVDTEMITGLPSDLVDRYIDSVPMGRICTPEEIATVVSFLLSDKAKSVTGQTLAVDGGFTYG